MHRFHRRSAPFAPVWASALACVSLALGASLGAAPFRRADFNQDGRHDIADAIGTLEHLFLGLAAPGCLDAADANDDGRIDIADPTWSLAFLFLGGAVPPAPYDECGVDPTDDDLSCEVYAGCVAPNLSELAGHCGGVPVGPYPNSLQPGDDLHRVTLDAPFAVCNDGTPAVFYVRAASPDDAAAADRWVFYLQGGGSCSSFTECLARWCGRQSAAYNESKMSSRYCPESIGGTGIFRRGGPEGVDNAFAGFHQVFLYYCSSDSWSGQRSDAVLGDPEDPARQFSIHFRGHDIVREALTRLLEGGVISDDGVVAMPALEDAELVLVTGFSAGSGGVVHNGDWIASELEPNGTRVRLVRDSSFAPPPETHPDPAMGSVLAERMRADAEIQWERVYSADVYDAFVDESAEEALAGNDDEWRLADKGYISHHHITTPMFVRMDLLDRPTRQRYGEYGVDPADFALMMERTLRGVPRIATTATEAAEIERPGGAFGTRCGDHVGLTTDSVFFSRTVEDDGGVARSYHDALLAWLLGADVVVVDDPRAPTTVCGAPVEENE